MMILPFVIIILCHFTVVFCLIFGIGVDQKKISKGGGGDKVLGGNHIMLINYLHIQLKQTYNSLPFFRLVFALFY